MPLVWFDGNLQGPPSVICKCNSCGRVTVGQFREKETLCTATRAYVSKRTPTNCWCNRCGQEWTNFSRAEIENADNEWMLPPPQLHRAAFEPRGFGGGVWVQATQPPATQPPAQAAQPAAKPAAKPAPPQLIAEPPGLEAPDMTVLHLAIGSLHQKIDHLLSDEGAESSIKAEVCEMKLDMSEVTLELRKVQDAVCKLTAKLKRAGQISSSSDGVPAAGPDGAPAAEGEDPVNGAVGADDIVVQENLGGVLVLRGGVRLAHQG